MSAARYLVRHRRRTKSSSAFGRVKRERKMLARLGRVLFWFAVIVAVLIVVGFVVAFEKTGEAVFLYFIPSAAIPWGIGWAIRYVLGED